MAVLLALTTCTRDEPLSPTRSWITPLGEVVTDPPELLVGAGDIGNCDLSGDEATALLLDAIPGTVFTTGDNAYEQGTDAQYANCYHPNWGRHKARTKPAPGNHEYDSPNAAGYYNYFGAAAGEIGKGYYSFNLGAWHVIVLNSSGGGAGTNVPMSKGSAQEQWLLADLAANQTMCTLAIWHHPLYQSTSGTGTGGLTDTKSRAVWDDLYPAGVELVLHGHRHFYERMAPQRPDRTPDPAFGIRSITVGSGGNGHSNSTNIAPNSEVRNSDTYGVLKLWLYPDSYAWKFVPVAGKTFSDSGSTACHGAPGSGPPVSASLSTVAASPSSLTAGSGSSTITVTVKDINGNPMSGVTVVLAATGSGNTLTQPTGPTNASGVATGTLSSTAAETKTLSATANGIAITQTATVSVTPGPVSATASTVTAAPSSIAAETGTSTVTVTARDADGNPISGATVVLAATGSGNTLTQPSGTTNASGVATGTLSSTVAESKTVSATISGTAVTQTASVIVTVGAVSAAQSTVAASPTTLTAGSGSATITVTVKDASGNPISGATVVLSASGSGNTLTQPSGTTNASGVATGTLSSTGAQVKTVSATANGTGITQTASVTVNPGPVSAAQSTVAASPASLIAGSGSSTITVTAKDANGNPISGATVVLAATGSGNTLTQPTGPTNASGVTTGTLGSTVAETKTVSATVNGTAVTQTAIVTVNSVPVSASQSTVAAAPTSLTAGSGSATITVTVQDASGNPISGATVVLAATGSGNTLTQPSGTTDASGVATGSLSSTVAQAKTVSATANGVSITQTASITVNPGPVSDGQSSVATSPTSLTAGSESSTITVTARDANNNPISGATVELAATGSGNTLTQPSGTTNASGVATGSLSSTVAGVKTISATINGTGITQTATVTVASAPVSASQSSVAAAPSSLTAGGSATITVTVRDASGNPIDGATVVLAATGSGNTLTQPSGTTDASGVATGTLSSTGAGVKTVSATANGTAITQTASITVVPGPVSDAQSTVAAAPASIEVGTETATITVTARDANGNPISGATVVLAATGSGNTLTQPSATTSASGVATGSLSSTVAEAKTLSATIDGTEITQTATITVSPAPVSASQSSVAAAPASLTAGSGSATITVTVRDASGNPISGATVVLAATGSGNTLTQPSGTSDASGVATGTLSSAGAGTKTVSATANGTAITQTASVSVTPGPVSSSASAVTAAPISIVAGTGSSTLTVTAKDANGNPISGATVVLSATGSGNTLTQPAGPTDASGTATGTLSSTVAEAKTVSASAGAVAITQTATVTVTPASSTVVLAGAANVSSCGNTRDEATATLLDAIPGNVILVGSGAYPNGSATAYADCYGPTWGRHKARTYPTPGNQDYQTPAAAGYFGYFGAQAGDPTKGYYSFDLGDWHIIVLNTGNEGTVSYGNGSAQELWLKADLAANTKLCTMAVLHNTRWFSSSTAGFFSSGAARYLWNDLYAAGADVVLSGRLYHYERMAPQNASGVRDDARGLRQFNLGNGGYTTTMPTFIAPNSEAVSAAFGVLRLTLASNSYSWEFLSIPGSTFTDSGSGTCH